MAAVILIAFSGSASGTDADNQGAVKAAPANSERGTVVTIIRDPGSRESSSSAHAAPRSETCPSARRAVRYYARRLTEWRAKLGAGVTDEIRGARDHAPAPCPRYLAKVLRAKARHARQTYENWYFNEYRWDHWLPQKYYRVARCETGVDWHFDSGTYVSAFGIIRAAFPTWNGHNSPREQYEVASSIQRKYGWSAWGCGGA